MIVAIIGSRNGQIDNLEEHLPPGVEEIVSGGAKGIDTCARAFAEKNGIKFKEYLPEYEKYGRFAPLRRNEEIVKYSDYVLAFWDGKSNGTKHVIKLCRKHRKNIKIIGVENEVKAED